MVAAAKGEISLSQARKSLLLLPPQPLLLFSKYIYRSYALKGFHDKNL